MKKTWRLLFALIGLTLSPINGTAQTKPWQFKASLYGFGLGSNFTWQIEPLLSWRFSKLGSLQGGYRWLSTDYETGSGNELFRYDMLTQGAQVGLTLQF